VPEYSVHNSVAGFVAGELVSPKRAIGCGLGRVFRAAVPETAVHKNRELELRENEISFPKTFWFHRHQ
jgi:hypothetical protein